MAKATSDADSGRRRGRWQNRENRASSKYVAKRVTEADHSALNRFAEAQGVKVSELLAPFVDDLIAQAHRFCEQGDDLRSTAHAS